MKVQLRRSGLIICANDDAKIAFLGNAHFVKHHSTQIFAPTEQVEDFYSIGSVNLKDDFSSFREIVFHC